MEKYLTVSRTGDKIKVEVYSSEKKRVVGGKGDLESLDGWKDENGTIHTGVKGQGFVSIYFNPEDFV